MPQLLPTQDEPTHIEVGEQRRDGGALRRALALVLVAGRSLFASPLVFLLDRHLQPLLEQVEHVPIADAPSQRLHQVAVGNAVEVAAQVCVHHFRVPRVHQGMDRAYGIQRTAVRSVGVLLRLQVRLENGFEDQHCRHLHHAITDRWNAQRPFFAVRFGNPYPPDWLRSIRLVLEFLRQFTQPLLFAVRFDVRERLPVHTGSAAVVTAPRQRMPEHIAAVHLVVERVEAIRGCSLRFGLQRLLQLLNR